MRNVSKTARNNINDMAEKMLCLRLLRNFGSLDLLGAMKKTQRQWWLTWSWTSNITSRLSTQTDAMVILMNLLNPIARMIVS